MKQTALNTAIKSAMMRAAFSGALQKRDGAPEGLAERMARQLKQLQAQPPLKRSAQVASFDVDERTVSLAFSSETEYERWFGIEVLGHEPGEIILDRMQDGAAVLVNHDWDDQVGIVESVEIGADRRGRAVVRFGRSGRANEIFQDIVDGIRKHVSVGYMVHDWALVGERDGVEIYRMTKWEPFEISIVAVPADTTVGVGRSLEKPHEEQAPQKPETAAVGSEIISESRTFKDTTQMKFRYFRDAGGNLMKIEVGADGKDVGQAELVERAGAERSAGTDAERARVRGITELATRFANTPGANTDELARSAINDGASIETFQRQILEALNQRTATPLSEQAQGNDVGMSDREVRSFSIMRAVRALVDPTDRAAQNAAAFEFEASRAAAQSGGKSGERFVIPTDVLRRALNSSTAGGAAGNTGGNLIANELMASSFVDVLRNRATIMRMGSVLGGLVGNIDIPKQIAAAAGYWLGEDDDATETGIELGQIAMTPKTVAAYSEITRKMLQQSSLDAEALVRRDLAIALALTMDKAGYYGSGTAQQPLGIANQTGINGVNFAAVDPTFAELVNMETQISLDNADVNGMAYVANAGFRGHAKTTLKFAAAGSATIWEQGGTVNGYRAEITNQIASGDVFMGNFQDLIIAMWGGLELTVDPFSNSKKGRLRLVVFQDVDFAVRRTESFCLGRKPA